MLPAMTEPTRSPCRAAVVAAGVTTPYVVAGHGPNAVLLASEPDGPGNARLHARFRVFAPAVPVASDPTSLAGWLDGFLDGLGLGRVLLLVDHGFAAFARSYATAAPDRVESVVPVTLAGDIDLEIAPRSLGA